MYQRPDVSSRTTMKCREVAIVSNKYTRPVPLFFSSRSSTIPSIYKMSPLALSAPYLSVISYSGTLFFLCSVLSKRSRPMSTYTRGHAHTPRTKTGSSVHRRGCLGVETVRCKNLHLCTLLYPHTLDVDFCVRIRAASYQFQDEA